MAIELTLAAAFMIGLLGSTHCIGMCGGIVGALTMGLPESTRRSPLKLLPYLLTYNSGRLLSYTLAGLLVGLLTNSVSGFFQMGSYPIGGIVGGLFMVALGIYIGGWLQTMVLLERLGSHLWKRIEPFGRRFMPVRSPSQALALGFFWGWLPCGLVYSTLALAATAGNAVDSAVLMLAFGVGTLPMLLAMGSFAERLQYFTRHRWIRYIAGILLIAFGVMILSKALSGGHHHMQHVMHSAEPALQQKIERP
ncbi:MAG: sulfite exporter TauE/SafE family protein [Gammaproteobacteria bacterium]|nr:sulfite exporter TauE/SafE family protein [Gammaproteobacteria bacterium]